MVSPVKPLEAMLLKVPVLMSDVNALKEISGNGQYTQLFNKGSVSSLMEKMLFSCNNDQYLQEMSEAAYEWIIKSRNWNTITKTMAEMIKSNI